MSTNCPILMQSEEINAPWNAREKEEIDYNVNISQSLSSDKNIKTNNYDEDYNPTNLEEDAANNVFTPLEYITICKNIATYFLEKEDYSIYSKGILEKLIKDADNWIEDEFNVERNYVLYNRNNRKSNINS